jgi:phosphoglycerate kinase
MINEINTLDDFDFKGKTVLCRFDMNSPLDPDTKKPRDITRIKSSLATIKELSQKGARTVILIHQGGDLEYQNYGSTKPHAEILSKLLDIEVKYIDDVCGPCAQESIKNLKDGQILMLENVRFMAEELTLFETKLSLTPQEQAKTLVVRKLAPLADYYVCDAFAASHRSQPTLVGMQEVLPSAMGRLFEKEIFALNRILQNPQRPCVYILGGAKIEDAFLMMTSALKKGSADMIIATGLVANIICLAKGISLGMPSEELIKKKNLTPYIQKSKEILKDHKDKIILPDDFAFSHNGSRKEVPVSQLPSEHPLEDIGSLSIDKFSEIIKQSKTIFLNGPAGVFEEPDTELGTKSLLNAIVKSDAFSVIGGGDSIAAINKYNLFDKFSYISTGGGALIRYLSGEDLPVVMALKKSAVRFR